MPSHVAASTDPSGPSDLLFTLATIALVVGALYIAAARNRTRSRRAHAGFATTGQGTWDGVIDQSDLSIFFPRVEFGFLKMMFLSEGIPVSLDLDAQGIRLRLRGRLMRGAADQVWSAPWREVLSAQSRPVGFKTLGGKISPVRLTDIVISTVGESARPFLEWWELQDDEDEDAPRSPDEIAEDTDWLAYAKDELGPSWVPGTGQVRIRMSAPDDLVFAVNRWARGTPPR